ncbi:MAG: hypothetical protein KTR32_30105 [Granulosicoccus sp.]|nr:hypothetical protein [Granulosicoccus sp.]
MVIKRTGEPWMPADKFGASLSGLGMNLLVSDVSRSARFVSCVFAVSAVYQDPDIAVISISGGTLLLHADHTYSDHPFSASVDGIEARGSGLEIRLYECDPDEAERQARDKGYVVLAGALDKPHGLRESYILDPDGYCWVPSRVLVPESL